MTQLRKIPALDDGQLLEHDPAGYELLEYCARARMRRDLIGAGLNARPLPVQSQIPFDPAGMPNGALLLQALQYGA